MMEILNKIKKFERELDKLDIPSLVNRLKVIEEGILALCYYAAQKDPKLWEEAVEFARRKQIEMDRKVVRRRRG